MLRGFAISTALEDLAIRAFVDARYLHLWHCHRKPERSFFVRRRQFHVCARCTGLIAGVAMSPLLLMLPMVLLPGCAISVTVMAADGLTQFLGFRTSTNKLRALTGISTGAFVSAAILALAINFMRRCISAE
jgi:uncharacterized membrane protein